MTVRRLIFRAAAVGMFAAVATPAQAQWSTTYEQFYLPGSFNWEFRRNYPAADKLFNAFDYGHAILYERLYTQPNAPVADLEQKEYDFITRKLLRNPPRVPLEEAAIEVQYAKLAPEAKMMFDWAHLLHRQIYDVWADESLDLADKDRKVAELLAYYKKRPDLAFSSFPKNMELMEGQYYSTAFRDKYPKFNGLIWAYHWLQVGLYEPLVTGKNAAERQTGVVAAVARFWQMLEAPPSGMPTIMPMTAAVAPAFSARYPEAAIIFDNLHSMHDVISDILASPKVARNQKRADIMKAVSLYRDRTSFVMTQAEWLDMSNAMGVNNMGGTATNFLAALPTPTTERGAVHVHGATAAPGASAAPAEHVHAAPATPAAPAESEHVHGDAAAAPADTAKPMAGMNHDAMHAKAASADVMMPMLMRMLKDPAIRQRVNASPEMRRMMNAMIDEMPADHRPEMRKLLATRVVAPVKKPASKPAQKKPAPKKPAAKDPHAGMDHSTMKK